MTCEPTKILILGVYLNSKKQYSVVEISEPENFENYSWFLNFINENITMIKFTCNEKKAKQISEIMNQRSKTSGVIGYINYFDQPGISISENNLHLSREQWKMIEQYEIPTREIEVVATRFKPGVMIGDFSYHLQDPELTKISLCIFNDNLDDWNNFFLNPNEVMFAGSGNAVARPFQHLGHSIGFPTGFRGQGFSSLEQRFFIKLSPFHEEECSVDTILQESYNRIVNLLVKHPEKRIIYYSVNPSDPPDSIKIGSSTFRVGDDVLNKITRLIQMIPDGVRMRL
jgi:hypothetical protein